MVNQTATIGGVTTVLITNEDVTQGDGLQAATAALRYLCHSKEECVSHRGKSLDKVTSRNHVDHSSAPWLKHGVIMGQGYDHPSLRG